MDLRPYQLEAVQAVESEWKKGHKRTLLVCPTASGKTIIFGQIIAHAVADGSKALILAHRSELLDQASDKLKTNYGLDSALEKAESCSIGCPFPITVGSIQTLAQDARLNAFDPDYFKTIVVDEAHHCVSDTYQKVLKHFKNANVLGVTATPDRADQKNLGQYFDSKAYEYTMRQAIKDGFLCPVRALMIPLKIDINNVHMSSGDFSAGESGTALEPYLNSIAEMMTHYCQRRKTVVFLPLIKTSQRFCCLLNQKGFKAVEVNASTSNRSQILKDFENGRYNVICNSMLLTEGWDCPCVDCIIVLRPTKNESLYRQCVGRGMRPCKGKENLLILDFLWLTQSLDLCRPAKLIAKSKDAADRISEIIQKSDGEVDLSEAEEQAERNIVHEREQTLAKQLTAQRSKKAKLVDPIQYVYSIQDEDLTNYEPFFEWEKQPATKEQLDLLNKRGISSEAIPNKGYASKLINQLLCRQKEGLASPKQIRCLERFGFRHVGEWSKEAASKMISILAYHNWTIPAKINPFTYKPEATK